MPQFFVHLGWAGDGLRYLLAEKLMIAPAHPLRRLLHRLLRYAHFLSELGKSVVGVSFNEKRLESFEQFAFARIEEFLS